MQAINSTGIYNKTHSNQEKLHAEQNADPMTNWTSFRKTPKSPKTCENCSNDCAYNFVMITAW